MFPVAVMHAPSVHNNFFDSFHFQIEFNSLLSRKKAMIVFFQENLNNHRFFLRFGYEVTQFIPYMLKIAECKYGVPL